MHEPTCSCAAMEYVCANGSDLRVHSAHAIHMPAVRIAASCIAPISIIRDIVGFLGDPRDGPLIRYATGLLHRAESLHVV